MFGTNKRLTKENVLDKVSSYQIFRAYSKNFIKVGQKFRSDLRKDPKPSACVEFINGDLLYTDFGEGSYRAIDFVQRRYGLTFKQALSKVNADFSLGLYDFTSGSRPKEKIFIAKDKTKLSEKQSAIIDIKRRDFTKEDLIYWGRYGWTYQMLVQAKIFPVEYYWLTMPHKGIYKKPFSAKGQLAYSYNYYEHNGIFRRKLYFPKADPVKKFISNVDNSIIQGWNTLPKNGGDLLFITSSFKDIGPFWRLNRINNSCAPNTEAAFVPEEIFYTKIKPRFKRIVLWNDNDATGIKNALKYAKIYDIEPMWNPLRAPKDPSDFVKEEGLREFNYLVNKQLDHSLWH